MCYKSCDHVTNIANTLQSVFLFNYKLKSGDNICKFGDSIFEPGKPETCDALSPNHVALFNCDVKHINMFI